MNKQNRILKACIRLLPILLLMISSDLSAQSLKLLAAGNEKSTLDFTIGYVNKNWHTDFGRFEVDENPWGEQGRRLHGLQLGVAYQPTLNFGLGLRTGLFCECYISFSDAVTMANHDDFTEYSLYMPLHALWRVPVCSDFSFSLFGGIGFNWALYGAYNDNYWAPTYNSYGSVYWERHSVPTEYQKYGNGVWPRHMNVQWEVGGQLRIKSIQAAFTYSQGITNHGFYSGYKTRQDKIGLSITWLTYVFGKQ